MKHDDRRIARSVLAPKAIILGAATFQFGWSLTVFMGSSDELYGSDRELFLFLSSALLTASACLVANRPLVNLVAAALCGPLPLAHVFGFWLTARRAEVPLFSPEHLRLALEGAASFTATLWVLTALSISILISVVVRTKEV